MPLHPRSPQEARNNATLNQQKNRRPSSESNWTNEKVKKLAQANQQQQQRTPKRKASTKPTPPRTHKTNKRKLSAAKSPAQVSFNIRAQQAALIYASESTKTKRPSNNKVVQFTDDTNDNSDTVIYNIQQDSGAYPPIQIVASSSPSIFSDPTFTNSQDHQPISSDTEPQEECPISIIPAPTKSTIKAMEQVQMDTSEYTAIQVDQDIGDSLTVEDQLRPPAMIYLDSPNGDLEGDLERTSNSPSPQPHSTFVIENEETRAKPPSAQAFTSKAPKATTALQTTTCDSPSGTSSVYATPPMSPYKRENSDSCTTDV